MKTPGLVSMHRLIIGFIFFLIGTIFCLILVKIYGRFSTVEVETWQQAVFTVMVVIAFLQLVTGYCIFFDKDWPVKISIFIAAFDLVIFPLGTFAGIYYFWYYMKEKLPAGKKSKYENLLARKQ